MLKIAKFLKRRIYNIVVPLSTVLLNSEFTYSVFFAFVRALPAARIRNKQTFFIILQVFQLISSVMRNCINKMPNEKRTQLAEKYLIPSVNRLFEKNYINYAQTLLLTLEEFFLSKETEKGFEDVLNLFSPSAITAGERYRTAFPLPLRQKNQPPKMGIVTHSVAVTGFEVVMGLGPYLALYDPTVFSNRVFDERGARTTKDSMASAGIGLVLTPKPRYDVFTLRKLVLERNIDIAVWPLPPFHMFFLYAFGVAPKQVWFSQYLRPTLNFSRLDNVITTGGAGTINTKTYNGEKWTVVPHVSKLEGITSKNEIKYLFTPARLEKLKQWKFMECVAEILKRSPNTHFRWTGYFEDQEVVEFFEKHGLSKRHTYISWMNHLSLVREIKDTNLILACFPLSLGTVENIATNFNIPIVSLYDDECNLYWRDIYWEAKMGNPILQDICLDDQGNSKILIAKTPEEYVQVALEVLGSAELAATYADVYRRSYDYAYFKNPNDISATFNSFVNGLYTSKDTNDNDTRLEKNNEMV